MYIANMNRKNLNFTQKVLLSLLKRQLVARTSLKVPNVRSRVSDLRKLGFNISCVPYRELKKRRRLHRSSITDQQTYYSLDWNSVTDSKLARVFGD